MGGSPQHRPGGAGSGRTAAQERQSRRHITAFYHCPAAIDVSQRMPIRETLLDRERNQLVCRLAEGCDVYDKREQPGKMVQAYGQRWQVTQLPSLGDGKRCLRQCLVGVAETKQANAESRACCHPWADPSLKKQAIGNRIIKSNSLFKMRAGSGKLTAIQ